jgi:dihydroorotate dehydrogenase electron transfer subunit
VLTGLGNGYSLVEAGEAPLLLGGGVGVPPLYMLAKKLLAQGCRVSVVLGFNTKDEVFYEEEFKALGADVTVATADGSYGVKGFVTNALPAEYSYFYTCGPEPMLKAVYAACKTEGQFSFEERMGCGFGACMGCSCKTVTGYKRICKEGPVLKKEEILWER